jgi:hypothetical protein
LIFAPIPSYHQENPSSNQLMQTSHLHRLTLAAGLTALLISCSEESPGAQQRIAELEARLASKQQEISDLQSKLNAVPAKPVNATPSAAPAEDRMAETAAVAAAADEVMRGLADKVKPGQLTASAQVAYAGFTIKNTSGSTGVAVPFFLDSPGGAWRCGWSQAQVISALSGITPTPSSPVAQSPAPVSQPATYPSVAPSSAPTPTVTASSPIAPVSAPKPTQGTAAAPSNLPPGWRFDTATGQTFSSDGVAMPALQPGERYGMISGGSGDTPRPMIIGRDGVAKMIVR